MRNASRFDKLYARLSGTTMDVFSAYVSTPAASAAATCAGTCALLLDDDEDDEEDDDVYADVILTRCIRSIEGFSKSASFT